VLGDPIVLTVLSTIFRGAVVLLLIVVFVPTAVVAFLLSRPRN
jgi:hypothetical protein